MAENNQKPKKATLREVLESLRPWEQSTFPALLQQLDHDVGVLKKRGKASDAWAAETHSFFQQVLKEQANLNGELNSEVVAAVVEKWIVFLNGVFLDRFGLLIGSKVSDRLAEPGLRLGQIFNAYYKAVRAIREKEKANAAKNAKKES